jgi:hypothetical protein
MKAYQEGAWWYSKVSDARKCSKFYDLKYLQKVPIVEDPSADLEFGSAMHLALNEILRGGDGIELFNMQWEISKLGNLQFSRLNWEELKNIGETLLARFSRLHAKHFVPFQMEERIYSDIRGLKFEGTPDFVGGYKDKKSIVDFKTAAYRYDKRKILCDDQMPMYAILAEKELNYKAEQLVYVVFIKDRTNPSIQVITRSLTNDILEYTLDNVILTCLEAQERKAFPMNTRSCLMGQYECPYFSKCFGGSVDE